MSSGQKYFNIIIGSVNILLHGLGSYLLIVWYKKDRKTSQKLLLINLALSELLFNIVALARDAVKMANIRQWFSVVNVATITGMNWLVLLAMFYMTGDRLLAVLLHIRYDRYCSTGKTIKMIIITGVVSVLLSILTGSLQYYKKMDVSVIILYVNPVISIVYFVFALMTYIVLFVKYFQSRRDMQRHTDDANISPWKAFVGSRFFIPVLLITSYLLLTVIPAIVRSILTWESPKKKGEVDANVAYVILSRLSYTVDAVIYIYLSKPVRNILLNKLRCRGDAQEGVTEISMVSNAKANGN